MDDDDAFENGVLRDRARYRVPLHMRELLGRTCTIDGAPCRGIPSPHCGPIAIL
jgi:hypothetical protein